MGKVAIKKPFAKLHAMKAKKPIMTGVSCGSRPPQYQAACYRARHQKVPAAALAAEKKVKVAIKKPAVKAKIAIKKPFAKLHAMKAKKPVVKPKAGAKVNIKLKPHIIKPIMTGVSCGS